jgi:hypothetical protein
VGELGPSNSICTKTMMTSEEHALDTMMQEKPRSSNKGIHHHHIILVDCIFEDKCMYR